MWLSSSNQKGLFQGICGKTANVFYYKLFSYDELSYKKGSCQLFEQTTLSNFPCQTYF